MRHLLASTKRRVVLSGMKDSMPGLKKTFNSLKEDLSSVFQESSPNYVLQGEYPYSLRLESRVSLFEEVTEHYEAMLKAGWKCVKAYNQPGLGWDRRIMNRDNQWCKFNLHKDVGRLPVNHGQLIHSGIYVTPITEDLAQAFKGNVPEDELDDL